MNRFYKSVYPFGPAITFCVVAILILLVAFATAFARCYRCNHRDREAKHAFEVMTGHPYGWHGHVVDHVIPLACGGEDSPRNMEWQTIEQGKEKDRWERNCAIWGGRSYPSMPATRAASQ